VQLKSRALRIANLPNAVIGELRVGTHVHRTTRRYITALCNRRTAYKVKPDAVKKFITFNAMSVLVKWLQLAHHSRSAESGRYRNNQLYKIVLQLVPVNSFKRTFELLFQNRFHHSAEFSSGGQV
jgi:hypothetical protein